MVHSITVLCKLHFLVAAKRVHLNESGVQNSVFQAPVEANSSPQSSQLLLFVGTVVTVGQVKKNIWYAAFTNMPY